jgi:16S rRNA (cytidine1402-2'-O)-methyltransferase
LGNLGDLSPRAREILSRASFIAGESTKVVLRWLEILGPGPEGNSEWKRPGVLTYRESSRDSDGRRILSKLQGGHSVALISDAGTPGVSDPGWQLVRDAREAGFGVWAVPGPCAAVAALSVSGFPSRRFSFEGFLPTSGRLRREALARLVGTSAPCLLYESPHRFLQTLQELANVCPQRELLVCREMTKKFEESWRGMVSEAPLAWSEKLVKGEFTLVLGPKEEVADLEADEVPEETLALVKALGLPTKSATRLLKHFFPKASKKELYRHLTN